MIGRIVLARETLRVAAFSVPIGTRGFVEADEVAQTLMRVRFEGAAHSMVVHRDQVELAESFDPMVTVIERPYAPGVYDVFLAGRTPEVLWAESGVSAEVAADAAVWMSGEHGYPVFWNGEPYLTPSIPVADRPEVPA